MKTPRVNDFDPDAKVPTLKSSMKDMPAIGKPKAVVKKTTPAPAIDKSNKHEGYEDSGKASMTASTIAISTSIEAIRKSVKHSGKEVTFVRLTKGEKEHLADIVYTYKKQGIKTSENEIARIGLNQLVEDYKANGQNSILAMVLKALND